MEKLDRIKKELKALLTQSGGVEEVIQRMVQSLPDTSPKLAQVLSIEKELTILSRRAGSEPSFQESEQVLHLKNRLSQFISNLETADFGEVGGKMTFLVGPASARPATITRKENQMKAIATTSIGVLVAIGAFLLVFYVFSLKLSCDQAWATARKLETCTGFQEFLELHPACPQVTVAKSEAAQKCSD